MVNTGSDRLHLTETFDFESHFCILKKSVYNVKTTVRYMTDTILHSNIFSWFCKSNESVHLDLHLSPSELNLIAACRFCALVKQFLKIINIINTSSSSGSSSSSSSSSTIVMVALVLSINNNLLLIYMPYHIILQTSVHVS